MKLPHNKRICLVGIGGVSMSALAEMMLTQGYTIFGCDRVQSARTEKLASMGIPVRIAPNDPSNIDGADIVIRTAAARDDAPEIMEARRRGIQVMARAEAWASLMEGYRHIVALSGTHGKSTTTGMCGQIALTAGLDPTISIGADLPVIGGNLRVGDAREVFIAEADEYWDSFLHFRPTVAVINNIEADHPDYFKSMDQMLASFTKFASLVPPDGCVVVNAENENAVRASKGARCRVCTFGLNVPADVTAGNLTFKHNYASFTLIADGNALGRITLSVHGIHNVYNAIGAAAAMLACGVKPALVVQGLNDFGGVARRFERRGTVNGAILVDDFGHHPTEMQMTMDVAKSLGFQRVITVFQPYTYSRTSQYFDDFVKVLSQADIAVLTEILGAREVNPGHDTSKTLVDAIPGAVFTPTFDDAEAWIRENAREGDLIVTTGCGNLNLLCDRLVGKRSF